MAARDSPIHISPKVSSNDTANEAVIIFIHGFGDEAANIESENVRITALANLGLIQCLQ